MVSMFQNDFEKIPLHVAIADKNIKIVELLLQQGADVTTKNINEDTPLHAAAITGTEIIELLIKYGADVNAKNYFGYTPLHIAVTDKCKPENVKTLLQHGADPNTKNYRGNTPLYDAYGAEIVELLLQYGVNPNSPNTNGDLPLHYTYDAATVKVLFKYGADVNAKDYTGNAPLHNAISYGKSIELIKTLLQHGADPNIKNNSGFSPLHQLPSPDLGDVTYAYINKIIETVLQHGADPNIKDNQLYTPLHHVLNAEFYDDDLGDDGDYATDFYNAAKDKIKPQVKTLIKYGADVNAKNFLAHSPLDYVHCTPKDELCDLLLRNGAKTNKESNFLYLTGASPNYHDKDTLVSDLENLLDQGYLNLNPPDPELQEIIAARLTPGVYAISDTSDLSMTVSSLVLRTLSVFSPFFIG